LKKVIHIISDVEKSHHLEWLTLQIKDYYNLKVILIGEANTAHQDFLRLHRIPAFHVFYKSKADLFATILKMFRLLRSEKPDLIHTHFWLANMMGIPISFVLRVPIRVMTRHHGDIHHQFHRKGLMIDIMLNKLASLIISPTKAIKNLMVRSEHARIDKIEVVNHGIDMQYFAAASKEHIDVVRVRYNIPITYPIIGVISRHTYWKGIQYIIPAFERLVKEMPAAHLVLANANGEYKAELQGMLDRLPEKSHTVIEYENDSAALYSIMDFFVHVPIDLYSESFGLTYIEALAAGKPSIFTISGVAADFIKHDFNALVVDYKSEHQIFAAIKRLLADPQQASKLIATGRESVLPYRAGAMGERIREVYSKQFNHLNK
jgi:glycosyltransferase involved in cell wall biosynthesis